MVNIGVDLESSEKSEIHPDINYAADMVIKSFFDYLLADSVVIAKIKVGM
jgi:hypothetical protein